jgi:hypothetical protein
MTLPPEQAASCPRVPADSQRRGRSVGNAPWGARALPKASVVRVNVEPDVSQVAVEQLSQLAPLACNACARVCSWRMVLTSALGTCYTSPLSGALTVEALACGRLGCTARGLWLARGAPGQGKLPVGQRSDVPVLCATIPVRSAPGWRRRALLAVLRPYRGRPRYHATRLCASLSERCSGADASNPRSDGFIDAHPQDR